VGLILGWLVKAKLDRHASRPTDPRWRSVACGDGARAPHGGELGSATSNATFRRLDKRFAKPSVDGPQQINGATALANYASPEFRLVFVDASGPCLTLDSDRVAFHVQFTAVEQIEPELRPLPQPQFGQVRRLATHGRGLTIVETGVTKSPVSPNSTESRV
jgi:hypothetical protein